MSFEQEYGRYCVIDTTHDSFDVIFFKDNNAIARRSFVGYSSNYVSSAIDNWLENILKVDHFTIEERLRA